MRTEALVANMWKSQNGEKQKSYAWGLPRYTSCLHVIGQGDVMRPNIVLPFLEANHATENIPRMHSDSHVNVNPGGVPHLSKITHKLVVKSLDTVYIFHIFNVLKCNHEKTQKRNDVTKKCLANKSVFMVFRNTNIKPQSLVRKTPHVTYFTHITLHDISNNYSQLNIRKCQDCCSTSCFVRECVWCLYSFSTQNILDVIQRSR